MEEGNKKKGFFGKLKTKYKQYKENEPVRLQKNLERLEGRKKVETLRTDIAKLKTERNLGRALLQEKRVGVRERSEKLYQKRRNTVPPMFSQSPFDPLSAKDLQPSNQPKKKKRKKKPTKKRRKR